MGEPMTQQRLWNYIFLAMEKQNQMERLARMRSEEEFPAAHDSDGSQHTQGAGDRMEKAILRRMAYEEQISPRIKANDAEMSAIINAIENLSNPLEREVLRLRYIDCVYLCKHRKWTEVAYLLYGDNDDKHMQSVYKAHKQALRNIAKEET